ncbi:sensor histidine kinase [Clostridium folliculivorans]|uniref:histidine kinase n=1 Tax=Clostridium folliculivorans TaxID=2886038 RepID=A0A9W6DBH5_9CLOT|nr:sensor histidine kinase [Clostridium folliculivorans]GKU25922.1 two-component sensor histidine kinase [Clostridium folliculivorans]GKU28008.1 two-component sensor histidine kinase [Clostridium folliculivorans]
MSSKFEQEKSIIFLRYIYIFIFILAFSHNGEGVYVFDIVFLLLFIINNQIRYFILPRKVILIWSSIIIETVLAYKLYSLGGIFGEFIFVLPLLDIIYNLKKVYWIFYALFVTTLLYNQNLDKILGWIIVAVPLIIILDKVKSEEYRKIEAQDLYDKLREKDEELKKVNKELEAYVNTIEEITLLRERNRVSREIHDNVGHALATIIIQLGAIEKISDKDGKTASQMAKSLGQFAKESLERVRAAVRAMKPRELEEYEGVIAISEMIKNFEKLTAVKVRFRVSDNVWKLNSDQTMVIYRIIQEFLSNSVRHGKATEIRVFLNFLSDHLRVHLKDNGKGCSDVVPGVGLSSIKERVSVWGGTLEYFTEINKGFELIVTMDKGKLSLDEV